MKHRRLVAGLVLAAFGGGCGLSTSDSPETVSQEVLPEDLGGPPESVDAGEVEGDTSVLLWFVSDDEEEGTALVSVPGAVPAGPATPTPQVLLEALFNYDTDQLEDESYYSAIPLGTSIRNVELDEGGQLVVDLPESFYEDPDTGAGRLAFGQVVATVTQLREVESVAFLRDGEEVPVTDGEGEDLNRPVTADDYTSIRLD